MNAEAAKLSTDIELEMKRVSELAERAKQIVGPSPALDVNILLNRSWMALHQCNVALHRLNPTVVTGVALPIAKKGEL